jgi:hypothetical protein
VGFTSLLKGESMKVGVYFETKDFKYSEVVAQFASEEIFVACLPTLEQIAKDKDMYVSESCREDEKVTDEFTQKGEKT